MPNAFVEPVESRTLYANQTGLDLAIDSNRTLQITGTTAADNIVLKGFDGYVEVTTPAGTQSIAQKKYRRIQINAGAGGDRVTLTGMLARSVTVFGGDGNDRLIITSAGSVLADSPATGLRPASVVTYNGNHGLVFRTFIDRPVFAFDGGSGDDMIALPRLATNALPGDIVNGGAGDDRVMLGDLDAFGVGTVVNLGQPKYDWAVLRTPLRLNSDSVEWITIPNAILITRKGVFQAVQVLSSQPDELTLPIVDQPPVMA